MVISLCSLGWPETHYVNQASFELTEILLPVSRVHTPQHPSLESFLSQEVAYPLQTQLPSGKHG